jgi:hypothetical protein
MSPQALHAFVTAAIVVLIVWRLYSRVRRAIGRQRLHPRRPWITLTILPLLLLSVLGGSIRSWNFPSGVAFSWGWRWA